MSPRSRLIAWTALVLIARAGAAWSQAPAQDAVQLEVDLARAELRGRVAATASTRPVSVTLRDGGGEPRAWGAGRVWPGDSDWLVDLADDAGAAVHPRRGDRIEAAVGAEQVAWEIPSLMVRFDREEGVLGGTALPGAQIEARVGAGAEAITRADTAAPDGRFRLAFGSGSLLRGGTPIVLRMSEPSGHRLVSDRFVPMTQVSLSPGDVNGLATPLSPLALRLVDGRGAYRGSGEALTDVDGRFRTWLRDAAGNRLRPAAGDRLAIFDGDGAREIPVAELTAAHDTRAGAVSGRGVPGARLGLTVWNPWYPGEEDEPEGVVDPSGRWTVHPAVPLRAGSHYYVLMTLPEGDHYFYCYQIPALHLQPGSPVVAIEAQFDVDAQLDLERDGRQVAAAALEQAWVGGGEVVLRDGDGRPVAPAAGDRLTGRLDGDPVDFPVGRFAGRIDPARGQIRGETAPGARVGLGDGYGAGEAWAVADADGIFAFDVAARLAVDRPWPGTLLSVFTLAPEGHSHHVGWRGAAFSAGLGRSALAGVAMPGEAVTVTVAAAGAASPSTHAATADALGRFEVPLARALDAATVVSVTTGSVTSGLTLPELGLAFGDGVHSARRGPADPRAAMLALTGPPLTALTVDIFSGAQALADSFVVDTDTQGRARLDLRSQPGRERLRPAQWRRLVLRHRPAVPGAPSWAAAPHAVELAVDPPPRPAPLFLPTAQR